MMHRSLTTQLRRWVRRQRAIEVSWVAGLLMIAALAAIMMPVSYRAGADHAHPHSVVQGMIDELRGTPHHHDHDDEAVSVPHASFLFAFDVPLAVSTIRLIDAGQPMSLHRMPLDPTMTSDSDLPVIDSIAIGGDVAGVILFVTALATILLATTVDRRLWTMPRRLEGIVVPLPIPPPR